MMSIFKTPTPPYRGQVSSGKTDPGRSLWEQITSLFRTPTPKYKARPAPVLAKADNDPPKP
jgi:hypothetical protein